MYEIHKKAAGQSAPAAFDSYPALFRKKKEILHKMKRLKTIASFHGNRNDRFFKVRRKNRKENGLIIGLFIKPARNRQRDKSRWIEWKTVQQCKKRQRELIVQIAVIFLTIC
ncbi:MAG: hypothetical protein ACLVG7_03790 [Negativibacillus sp.]